MRAVLRVDHDPRIIDLFAPEDKKMRRGHYTVSDEKDSIAFNAEADDATAMRAILNSITKTLALWERSEGL